MKINNIDKIIRLCIFAFAFTLNGLIMAKFFPAEKVLAAEDIKLNKTKLTVEVGTSYTLKINGTKEKVTWKSSNSKIAKVDKSGKVTGVKEGNATITATVGKKSYTCKVTVIKQEYKIAGSGLAKVKSHQEIINNYMTVAKTINKVTVPVYGDEALTYIQKSDLVEIKLGYLTDKNKIRHYIIAVTNLTDKAFENGEFLSYGTEEGNEAALSLEYIQPGETRFYKFGTSNKDYGYTDYNYFKGLSFSYYKTEPWKSFKDIRKDFKITSKEEYSYYFMILESKQQIKDNYEWEIIMLLMDKNGKLITTQSWDTSWVKNNKEEILTYDGIPSSVLVVVNYIVETHDVSFE